MTTFAKSGILAIYQETQERLDLLLAHADSLPAGKLVEPVPAFGASVRDQLLHVISVEGAWVRRVQGLAARRLRAEDFPDAGSLVRENARVKAATLAYLDALPDDALDLTVVAVPPDWSGPPQSPGFILHHVITHTFHHKGQIATMFRLLGHPIGDTDLQRG